MDNPKVVIDRKQSLLEVCSNVGQQHVRFRNELKLAKDLGYKLIILIEQDNITNLNDVYNWYNWRVKKSPKAINGRQLYTILKTIQEKYNVEVLFTPHNEVGNKIIELLEV